jgi:hypothetical protein
MDFENARSLVAEAEDRIEAIVQRVIPALEYFYGKTSILDGLLALDQAKPARLGEARNQKNSKSLVFLRRLMK